MDATKLIDRFGGWTEEYLFYKGEIMLRYDPVEHVYLLVTENGDLEKQDGVSSVCKIIDKSAALVPWGCKMMSQKLLRTAPWIDNGPDLESSDTIFMTRAELEKWVMEAKDAHKEKLEDAGAVGHIAHNWLEGLVKFLIDPSQPNPLANIPYDERAKQACLAATDWMLKHNVRWIATERKVYSRKWKYAGTMDGLCLVDSCGSRTCTGCRGKLFKDHLSVMDYKTSNYLYLEYLMQTAEYQNAIQEEDGIEIRDRWLVKLGKEDGDFEAWRREPEDFELDFQGFLEALALTRRVKAIETNLQERKADIRQAEKQVRIEAKSIREASEKAKKVEAKVKKQEERLAALALNCTKSKTYKGKKSPSCTTNQGGPCVKCLAIYGIRPLVIVTSDKPAKKPAKPKVKKERPEPKKPDYSSLDSILMYPTTGPTEVVRIRIKDGVETRTLVNRETGETKPITEAYIGESVSWHVGDDGHGNAIAIYEEDEETVKKFYENWGNEKTTAALSKEPAKSATSFNFFSNIGRK